ncbi:MAG: peptidoglycan DD-metalloendopeptidase family protein [bacterium]|nr:peptidoglycan DD-metalloendopeptidase family protein [bacterium]
MKKCFVILALISIAMVLPLGRVYPGEIDDRIEELKEKIAELQGEENSLSKQISLLNSQIALTTLRIGNTRSAIGKLDGEIDELAREVDRLEEQLTKRSELVLRRVPASYKRQAAPVFGILLTSLNFSDLLSRMKYLARVQEEDVAFLFQLKVAQTHFGEKKTLREDKKIEQEKLKKELEQQTKELEVQKRNKQVLLTQTRNDEAVYQSLLAQALAEKLAIERALVDSVEVGPVKRGDVIALVGNTGYPGCSSGKHLHFEVRKNNSWVDPGGYLSSKNVNDEQNGGTWTVGGGSWEWPIQDTIRLTQHFGQTPWSWQYSYSGGIHTGFDMVSTSSDVIRAPSDGTLYSSSQTCGTSSIIKIKYIDHGDGVLSFYLHVQ